MNDIDISNETLKEKFQLKRSKFERVIRRKKAVEAKAKKMRQNRREQCSEIFHISSLNSSVKNAHVKDSTNKKDSGSSQKLVKANITISGEESLETNNSNTLRIQKISSQLRRFGTDKVHTCFYAKKFCSLSIKSSAMSKSASIRLDRLLNANDNIFDKLKSMEFRKSPNISKKSIDSWRDNNQPIKRKRKNENETEFDLSNETKRVRLDI